MKKTPWFSGAVRPVRKGLYERKYLYGDLSPGTYTTPTLSVWNGREWVHQYDTTTVSGYQPHFCGGTDFYWRGVFK